MSKLLKKLAYGLFVAAILFMVAGVIYMFNV